MLLSLFSDIYQRLRDRQGKNKPDLTGENGVCARGGAGGVRQSTKKKRTIFCY